MHIPKKKLISSHIRRDWNLKQCYEAKQLSKYVMPKDFPHYGQARLLPNAEKLVNKKREKIK